MTDNSFSRQKRLLNTPFMWGNSALLLFVKNSDLALQNLVGKLAVQSEDERERLDEVHLNAINKGGGNDGITPLMDIATRYI